MTALSMLNDLNIPSIKVVARNKLFYNKFKYRASIYLFGAHLTRRATNIREYIDFAKFLISRSVIKKEALLYPENIELMERFFNLYDSGYQFQKRIEQDNITLFFNDIEFLNLVNKVSSVEWVEVVDQYDFDKLYIRNPKYKYRTYIKPVDYKTDKESLKTFVDYANNISDVSCSAAIDYAVNGKRNTKIWARYTYYFRGGHIDYNDEKMISIIGIYLGPMVKNTVQLIRRQK